MVMLRGPAYDPVTTIAEIPNPQFGDSEQTIIQVVHGISMERETEAYTYLKKMPTVYPQQYRILNLQFDNVPWTKALNISDFIRSYSGGPILYTDHNTIHWWCKVLNLPFELTHSKVTQCDAEFRTKASFKLVLEGTTVEDVEV